MLPDWLKKTLAILLVSVAVHIIYAAMMLAGLTTLSGDFGAPIAGAIVLCFGMWALLLGVARRFWHHWLIVVSIASILYAAVTFVRRSPDANDPRVLALNSAQRVALAGLLLCGVIAGAAGYRSLRRDQR